MTGQLSVDIVINNFNYGRFLADAIESALAQTHDACTTIVVDDGSSDESRDVIRSFGDNVVAVFKENGGQASAFNAGFARCRGDIVIFLDADDLLAPDVSEKVSARFSAEGALARVQYRMEVIDASGARTGIVKPPPHVPLAQGDLRRHVLSFPFDVACSATSGNSFSTPVLERIMPVPEAAFRLGADWYLLHLTPLFGTVAALDTIGGYYRIHGSNNYESMHSVLDFDHVRQSIMYAERTSFYIQDFADSLPTLPSDGSFVSVSSIANRLASLRIEPERHPIRDDTRFRLAIAGMRVSLRRFDVTWPMRALFILWFVGVTIAPRPIARRLVGLFLIPERRQRLNRLLGSLHRRQPSRIPSYPDPIE
jgi:hypothetical protein